MKARSIGLSRQDINLRGKNLNATSQQSALITGRSAEGKLPGHFLDDQTYAKKEGETADWMPVFLSLPVIESASH